MVLPSIWVTLAKTVTKLLTIVGRMLAIYLTISVKKNHSNDHKKRMIVKLLGHIVMPGKAKSKVIHPYSHENNSS